MAKAAKKTAEVIDFKTAKKAVAVKPAKATKAPKAPAVRTAQLVGTTKPKRAPKGHFVSTYGKTFAVQEMATNEITTFAAKLNAAVKEIAATGGVITKGATKAAGLDFAELVTKLQANKKLHVVAKATQAIVTPKAAKADLIPAPAQPVAAKAAAKPAKAAKTPAPVEAPKASKKAAKVEAPKGKAKAAKVEAPKASKKGSKEEPKGKAKKSK